MKWFDPLPAHSASLEVTGICKAYNRVPVLYPLNLSLGRGDGLALLGPNGSGKTTLLRLLAGTARASAGRVVWNHQNRRPEVGFVGHDSYLYEDLTGIENLRFFEALSKRSTTDVRIGEALAVVDMVGSARERVRAYSAGMKRRLSLARVLLMEPEVILLDEPHASLDAQGQALVDAFVLDARAGGRLVVLASHDHERALQLCSSVLCLDGGRVTFQGKPDEFLTTTPLFLLKQGAP